jgi:hypothetical protein
MAVKFWIGGATTSNWSDNTKWSQSSGGPNDTNAAVAGDDAYFDSNSGSGTVVVTPNAQATNIFFRHPVSGDYSGALRLDNDLRVRSSFTLSPLQTVTGAGFLRKTFSGGTWTFNNITWSSSIQFDTIVNFTLADNINILGGLFGATSSTIITVALPRTITIGTSLQALAGISAPTSAIPITFRMVGTGNLSGFMNNVTIDIDTLGVITQSALGLTSGNITITNIPLGNYISTGVVSFGGFSSLNNVASIFFQGIAFLAFGGQTLTLNSNVNTVTFAIANAVAAIMNGATMFVSGNFTATHGISGTANIEMIGPSNANISSGSIQNNLKINKSSGAIVTFTGSNTWGAANRVLELVTEVVVTNGTTLTLAGSTVAPITIINSFPTNSFFNIATPNIIIVINGNTLRIRSNLSLTAAGATFQGAFGWDCNNLICSTAGPYNITLQQLVTYRTRAGVAITGGTNANRVTMRSSLTGTDAIWTLDFGATQSMIYVNGLDIDSSGGQTIWSFGVLTTDVNTSINWNPGVPLRTVVHTFVN